MGPHRQLAIATLAIALIAPGLLAPAHAQQVEVDGTRFRVTVAGRELSQAELIGATLHASDGHGNPLEFRIAGADPDPRNPQGDVYLYDIEVRDATGGWRDLCRPGPDGLARGFPVRRNNPAGSATFELTCTSGAVGKCIRMGYRPWAKARDGTSLEAHHQACVRMVRADYCGNGETHTRTGTPINVFDRLGIQKPDPEPTAFEAAWGPDGAVCVRKTRIPELLTIDALQRMCPDRLHGRTGDTCREKSALDNPHALVFNRS